MWRSRRRSRHVTSPEHHCTRTRTDTLGQPHVFLHPWITFVFLYLTDVLLLLTTIAHIPDIMKADIRLSLQRRWEGVINRTKRPPGFGRPCILTNANWVGKEHCGEAFTHTPQWKDQRPVLSVRKRMSAIALQKLMLETWLLSLGYVCTCSCRAPNDNDVSLDRRLRVFCNGIRVFHTRRESQRCMWRRA